MGETPGSVLSVVEVESGQRVWEVAESAVHVLSVTYSPDGRTVAAGCGWFNNPTAIGYVRLRDAATGSPLGEPIRGSPGGVLDVAFAPDGNQIALASRDVTDIYDIASPNRPIVMRLRGHVNFVYAVSFSPDGRCVVTGGWDKTIRLWDRATGAQLQTLIGHRGFVRGLAFSADGAATCLVQRRQKRAPMGIELRCRDRRIPRTHRVCTCRGVQPRRYHGRLGQPRWDN